MKNTTFSVLAAAIALSFGAGALADSMTKPQYTSEKKEIEASYKSAKVTCDTMKDNVKDVCLAEAKGREKVALADLDVTYKPSTKTRYDARVAKADAEYSVAKQKCDDLSGNTKDVCRKEAESAHTAGKADAKAHMKTVEANSDATKKVAEAHKDAATEKREADYSVAREKCDAAAGAAKDACIANAKARYGKS